MAFTRYNYDECRTKKFLQQSTDPGRYVLNTPGWGATPVLFDDPQMRHMGWSANLQNVSNGHPIDIESQLKNVDKKLQRYGRHYKVAKPLKTTPVPVSVSNKPIMHQSRVTHPGFLYRDLKQDHTQPLYLDPQENVCLGFQNNLNTRLLEKDNHTPIIPCTSLIE
tara:strand:+ start:1213 stop:1707 length:495 start_codon:yes stop_codon:yes gene_type:complete